MKMRELDDYVEQIKIGLTKDMLDELYCRIVSYVEQGCCRFFSIFNEVEQRSICSNGQQVLCQGQEMNLSKVKNPIIAVMYNMHYSKQKNRPC